MAQTSVCDFGHSRSHAGADSSPPTSIDTVANAEISQTEVWATEPMTDNSAEGIIVLMTAANREEAVRIAEMLVSTLLAGCVQILPEIQSIYRWQGEVARESEVLLLCKTTSASFDELERRVREIHSYEIPEIVALPVTQVSAPYLQWLQEAITPGED